MAPTRPKRNEDKPITDVRIKAGIHVVKDRQAQIEEQIRKQTGQEPGPAYTRDY
jgi:hypothetical protein